MYENNRILIVDDNRSIHDDFRKILTYSNAKKGDIDNLERALFDEDKNKEIAGDLPNYMLDDALFGREALQMVEKARKEGRPYALAFIDERMPPGWSGVETISKIWEIDPLLEVVICTAYSDYSWDEIIDKLGLTDRLLFLKKPFDAIEVKQLAGALIKKWNLAEKARIYEEKLRKEISVGKERLAIIEKQNEIFEKEIDIAQKVQFSLLPQNIPEIKNARVAFKYIPILMGVGGDLIDIYYREGDCKLGLFICDVSGHGVSAAFLASMTKMALNSWGDFIDHPQKALEEIRYLLAKNIGNYFITACICCIDLEDGIMTFASAGHPPIAVLRRDGDIELFNSKGRLINYFFQPNFEEKKVSLKKNDKVILYTDGITEAENSDGEMIGDNDDKFCAWIKKCAGASFIPSELCQSIYDGVIEHTGNKNLDDDFTILVAEYLG